MQTLQVIVILAIFLAGVALMMTKKMPAILALPCMGILIAVVAGVPFISSDAETQSITSYVIAGGASRLASTIIVTVFGAIFAKVIQKEGISDAIIRKAAELAGDTYFNSLGQERTEVTFVEMEDGPVLRKGKKGAFVCPQMAPFETMDAGQMEKKARLLAERPADWITVKYVDEPYRVRVETAHAKICFAKDGSMESFYDRDLDREWTDGAFHKLHIYQDLPGVYDAWDILPNYKEKELEITVKKPLHLVVADGACALFEVVLGTEASSWKMQIRLFADSNEIEVEHLVDWHEKHKLAKMEFGMNLVSRELVCDTSAGFIRRETHKNTSWQQARFEVCMHKWCDMAESDGGIAILNDGKYGVGVDENHITLSLLRATIRPDITSDMGKHDFCYRIVPHAGNHLDAGINRRAFEFNVPLKKTALPQQFDGRIDAVIQKAAEKKTLYVQAVKMSEDEKNIIIRLSEQDGTRGKLVLPFAVQPVNLLEDSEGERTDVIVYHPFELVSFAIPVLPE